MAHSLYSRCLVVTAMVMVSGADGVRAQTASGPPPVRLTVLTVGGFLGQLDGFCEPPGGTYDIGLTPAPTPCLPGGPGGPHGRAQPGPGPTPPWPAALGGVLGAGQWLEEARRQAGTNPRDSPPLVLLAGNNQLPDFGATTTVTRPAAEDLARRKSVAQDRVTQFWDEVARLRPHVVGLGPEDFIRSLRDPVAGTHGDGTDSVRAQYFANWVRRHSLPLLASNAVVRLESPRLNTVAQGSFDLKIDRDASVGWVQTLALEHPVGASMAALLDESVQPFSRNAARRGVAVTLEPGAVAGDRQTTTIRITEGSLLPGRHYRLRLTVERRVHEFLFRTHDSLMPDTLHRYAEADPRHQSKRGPASAAVHKALEGFPVVFAAAGADEDVLIVSLVAPSTALGLGESAWRFPQPGAHPQPSVTEPTFGRIALLPPAAALDSLLRRVAAVEQARIPFIILISSLEDAETMAVLEAYPEIRMVVLPPDSTAIGRTSRETATGARQLVASAFSRRSRTAATDPKAFGGDLGLSAVYNAHEPQATTLVTRPEWVGETGATLTATLSRNAHGEWTAGDADVQVATIAGSALQYTTSTDGVSYHPVGRQDLSIGPFPVYHATSVTEARDNDANFIDIWKSRGTFAAVTGEAVRTALYADIAVVPEDVIDGDALGWLAHALSSGSTQWLSRFVLERALFRSYRFVRADVAGRTLLDTIGKAVSDPLETGVRACVVGLGLQGCPVTLDKAHPERVRVRGRAIVPELYYNVALPDTLAEKLGLTHDDDLDDSADALVSLDAFLAAGRWQSDARPGPPGLPAEVENRARSETRHYVSFRSLEIGFSRIRVSEPDARQGILGNLPQVEFGATKPERIVSGKIDGEWAIFEQRRRALRGVGLLDFSRRETFANGEIASVTYPRDEFTVGVRYDRRYITRFGAFEYRPFFGVLWEGQLRTSENALKASGPVTAPRPDFTATQTAGFATTLTVPPSRYLHATAGLDVLPAATDVIPWAWLDAAVKRISGSFSDGRRGNVLDSLRLGDEEVGIDDFLAKGGQALLDDYLERRGDAFTADVEWTPGFRSRRQRRVQIEAEGDLVVTFWERAHKLGLALRYRRYDLTDAASLSLEGEWKFATKLTVPIHRRLELVPAFEYQRATINADNDNAFAMRRFEIRLNIPLFVRLGRGSFIH